MTNPAWTRTAGIDTYGGHAQKRNYANQGKIDALTDIDADDINRIASDLSTNTRMQAFLVARLTLNDTSPAAPTVHWCAFQPTGVSTTNFAGDAPPTGFPTFTRLGNGNIEVTFSASYSDEYGNSASTNLEDADGGGAGATFANVVGEITSAVVAEFTVTGTAGTAIQNAVIHIEVY